MKSKKEETSKKKMPKQETHILSVWTRGAHGEEEPSYILVAGTWKGLSTKVKKYVTGITSKYTEDEEVLYKEQLPEYNEFYKSLAEGEIESPELDLIYTTKSRTVPGKYKARDHVMMIYDERDADEPVLATAGTWKELAVKVKKYVEQNKHKSDMYDEEVEEYEELYEGIAEGGAFEDYPELNLIYKIIYT